MWLEVWIRWFFWVFLFVEVFFGRGSYRVVSLGFEELFVILKI